MEPDDRRYLKAWWRYALGIWCFDHGEPQLLAHIVSQSYLCPPQLAPVLGDIIAGRRRPNRKAAVKRKFTGIDAAVRATKLAQLVDLERQVRHRAMELADEQRVEPHEVIEASHERVRRAKARLAEEANISVDTLEKTERALRKFVEGLTPD